MARRSGNAAHAVQGQRRRAKYYFDYSLVFAVIFLTAFGLLMIYSSSSYIAQIDKKDSAYYLTRQARYAGLGFLLMIITSRIDYHWFLKWAVPAYWLSYVLMIAVAFVGREVNGQKRWLALGPLSFQPTEFAKFALILFLSVYIANMGNRINHIRGILTAFLWDLPIAALVAKNNLSSGIIVGGLVFVMTFAVSKRYIFH